MAVNADAKAVFRSLMEEPHGFERKAGEIENRARRILERAGVTEPHLIEEAAELNRRHGQLFAPSWRAAVPRIKAGKGSPEYLAAEALDCLSRVRIWLKNGHIDTALEEAITLGALGVSFGKKMLSRQTGEAASAPARGKEEIITAWNIEMSKTPRPRIGVADAAVAKRLGIGPRTVLRARRK